MTYNADYFIEGFSGIPDEFWCTEYYSDGKGRFCALGHLGVENFQVNTPEEVSALEYIIYDSLGLYVSDIVDGNDRRYQQSTPKARILASLEDAKKIGILKY